MATTDLLRCVAFVSSFFCVFFLASGVLSVVKQRSQAVHLQQQAGSGTALGYLLRNGIPVLKAPAKALLRVAKIRSLLRDVETALVDESYQSSDVALMTLALGATIVVAVAGCVVGSSAVAGIALATCLWAVIVVMVGQKRDKRHEVLRESIPDVLRSMSMCFHAGFSLQQTFLQLQKEAPHPLDALFARCSATLESGGSIDEALDVIRADGAVRELSFVAVALSIQHRSGGSMQTVLDAACDSLEGELELQRSLRVQTAQAKLSARVVSVVTLVLVAVLSLISEDFLGPFFQSATGLVMLTVAIVMQVAGVVAVRRLLRVQVDR